MVVFPDHEDLIARESWPIHDPSLFSLKQLRLCGNIRTSVLFGTLASELVSPGVQYYEIMLYILLTQEVFLLIMLLRRSLSSCIDSDYALYIQHIP